MPRGFLIVLNTALLLGFAEGGARFAEWIHPATDTLTFAYSPYRMLKTVNAPWPLNREGFRAQELETYRDSFLVEFLGGSVCLGIGDDPGEAVPERLERALHESGLARARVLNLCQGGVTSAQELAILVEYGLPLHPQAVLSFDGANDVLHPRPIGEDDAPNRPYLNTELEARVDGRDAWSHLALIRVTARFAARLRSPLSSREPPVAIGAIIESYLYHLSLARSLAESNHAFYAVLLQPALHLDKPWNVDETAMWRSRRPHDGEPLTRTIRQRYGEARESTSKWALENGTALYDLTRAFAATSGPIYSDSVHFRGSRGYELLFAELRREGLLDRLAERYREWETSL